MELTLEGPGAKDETELTVSITLRRLGQYKTAWPAVKTTLLQAGSTTSEDLLQVCSSDKQKNCFLALGWGGGGDYCCNTTTLTGAGTGGWEGGTSSIADLFFRPCRQQFVSWLKQLRLHLLPLTPP